MRLTRLYHTVKYLNFKQIAFRIKYKAQRIISFRYPFNDTKNHRSYQWLTTLPSIPNKTLWNDEEFTFIGISHRFKGLPDWELDCYGKLWTYNLNYFDFLNQDGFPVKKGLELMHHFCETLQSGSVGSEPYPASLRGINWIRFLSVNRIHDEKIIGSLYNQYRHLSQNIEYHLLGNHLLENGFSLFIGGIFFRDKRFLLQGEKILREQLSEQILPDGAHFELSPMYHQIIFNRLLDTINILKHQQYHERDLLPFLEKKASAMASWLINICWKNGTIPLVNDAAPDISPDAKQLLSYCKQLNINPVSNLHLSSSGYRKFEGKRFELLADAGPIGPDYIPGHGHADMLHFDIHVDGKPFLQDTGTSTYENNKVRHYERSTMAHNTVTCGDWNQSDVWSSFRVGKRAKISIHEDEPKVLRASHHGYTDLGIIHERTFSAFEDHIIIKDKLSGYGNRSGKARFHFAPGIVPVISSNIIETPLAVLRFNHAANILPEDCEMAVSFNNRIKATKIVVTFNDHLETTITF